VTATISWANTYTDLNAYLYDPAGSLVAKSEGRYTTSETVQYNRPAGGYYLLKVTASNSYSGASFKGTASANTAPAYVKTGTVGSTPVTFSVTGDGSRHVNARVAWTWSYSTISLSLLDQAGKTVAHGAKTSDGFNAAYEQFDCVPASGAYTLKLASDSTTRSLSYKLVTPFRL